MTMFKVLGLSAFLFCANGAKFTLSLYGTGHASIDNSEHMNAIIAHIQSKKQLQFEIERDRLRGRRQAGNPMREGRDDMLYDAALYFIPPHRFKPADLEYIQRLNKEVTVVLVCAKADAMTERERNEFQRLIRNEMVECMPALHSSRCHKIVVHVLQHDASFLHAPKYSYADA